MKTLFLILIGVVSIAAFIGISSMIGRLIIKLNIIENDGKSEFAIGLLMLFFLVVLLLVCYIVGENVLSLVQ